MGLKKNLKRIIFYSAASRSYNGHQKEYNKRTLLRSDNSSAIKSARCWRTKQNELFEMAVQASAMKAAEMIHLQNLWRTLEQVSRTELYTAAIQKQYAFQSVGTS